MSSEAWLQNPWLTWGVGAAVATNIGFFLAASLLELVLQTGWFDDALLSYASSNNAPRKKLLVETHKRIPFRKQLKGCAKVLLGAPTIAASVALAILMQLIAPGPPTSWWPGTITAALLQLLALAVVADFGLYWGHRVQHEFEFLWKFHAKHHAIDTPTPFSTLFIHPTDLTLQGSLPFALAAAVVRPAPAILHLFIAARVAENAINHSGLDSRLVDLLTLKVLPFRASIGHHDAHHKYSNHAHNAKNYGETFWIWDALFKTSSPLSGHALAAKVH